jgi:hypothetical protein
MSFGSGLVRYIQPFRAKLFFPKKPQTSELIYKNPLFTAYVCPHTKVITATPNIIRPYDEFLQKYNKIDDYILEPSAFGSFGVMHDVTYESIGNFPIEWMKMMLDFNPCQIYPSKQFSTLRYASGSVYRNFEMLKQLSEDEMSHLINYYKGDEQILPTGKIREIVEYLEEFEIPPLNDLLNLQNCTLVKEHKINHMIKHIKDNNIGYNNGYTYNEIQLNITDPRWHVPSNSSGYECELFILIRNHIRNSYKISPRLRYPYCMAAFDNSCVNIDYSYKAQGGLDFGSLNSVFSISNIFHPYRTTECSDNKYTSGAAFAESLVLMYEFLKECNVQCHIIDYKTGERLESTYFMDSYK